jgi:hypothetical protein
LVLVDLLVLTEILTVKTEIFQALMVWNPLEAAVVEEPCLLDLLVLLVAEAVELLHLLVVLVTHQALAQAKEMLAELLNPVVAEAVAAVVEQVQ